LNRGNQIAPATDLDRPPDRVLGVLVLIGLVLSRVVRTNSQGLFSGGAQPSIEGSAGQPETDPQSYPGTTVWILGRFVDEQGKLFLQSLRPLEDRTGIEVTLLTGDETYDLDLETRLESEIRPIS
jgi:hypothetical protein